MSLFSRLLQLIRIRAYSALDKVEDPGQVMDYTYNKQIEQLQELRRSIIDVVTSEKRLEMQQEEAQRRMDKLGGQARQALIAHREDLARLALQRQEELISQLNSYEQHIAQLKTQAEKLIRLEHTISAHVESFRTEKQMMKAQYSAAQAQVKINEIMTGLSQETSALNLAMQRAQDHVVTMQARANAMESLLEQGSLVAGQSLAHDHLDSEFRHLNTEHFVETQLQAMKQQLQLGGQPHIQEFMTD